MGLVVLVGARPEIGRVFAPRPRLDVEVVRLSAPFVDEVAGKLQMGAVAGGTPRPDQGEFDLLVARIAAPLAVAGTE